MCDLGITQPQILLTSVPPTVAVKMLHIHLIIPTSSTQCLATIGLPAKGHSNGVLLGAGGGPLLDVYQVDTFVNLFFFFVFVFCFVFYFIFEDTPIMKGS